MFYSQSSNEEFSALVSVNNSKYTFERDMISQATEIDGSRLHNYIKAASVKCSFTRC